MTTKHRTSTPRSAAAVAYTIGGFGTGVLTAVNFAIPLYAIHIDIALPMIGVLVAAGSVMPALFAVPMGSWIDRFGPRTMYIVATASAAALTFAIPLFTTFAPLVLVQLGGGMARSLGWIASHHYISSFSAEVDRPAHTSRFSFFANASQIPGPLLAGFVIQELGFGPVFILLGVICLGFTISGIFMQRLPRHRAGGRGMGIRPAIAVLKQPNMGAVMSLNAARLWSNTVWDAFVPALLVTVGGMMPGMAGIIGTFKSLSTALTTLPAGRLAQRFSPERASIVSVAFGTLAVSLAPFMLTLPGALLPAFLAGLGSGMALPLLLLLVSEYSPPDHLGVAFGLRTSVNQAAHTVGPLSVTPMSAIVGNLVAVAASSAFAWAAVLVAVAKLWNQPHAAPTEPEPLRDA